MLQDSDSRTFTFATPSGVILLVLVLVGGGGTTLFGGDVESVPSYRPFIRGDVDQSGDYELNDAIELLNYLFLPGSEIPGCLDAADVNDDEELGLSDPLDLLNFLFLDGADPAPPLACGEDPTLNVAVSCEEYAPCSDLTDLDEAAHIMRRLGFGPTPEGLDRILAIGADAYIQEQLFPEDIDESDNELLNLILPTLNPESDLLSIVQYQVVRALYSERQLQEALTEFWEYHFNTEFAKSQNFLANIRVNGQPIYTPQEAQAIAVGWEFAENTVFRDSALGNFRDHLLMSATSEAMLVYLDGVFNYAEAPNENYARELLELHTMGVDNGYTQQDIEEVARCFTGWTLCVVAPEDVDNPHAPCLPIDDPTGVIAFRFVPELHDYGAKTIFVPPYQLEIPARPPFSTVGILDGFEVLEHLAGLTQTADFVSEKLIRRLLNDEVPQDLIVDCRNAWLASDADLREVVSVIVNSDEFLDPVNRWTKVYTPFEFLIAQHRAMGALTSGLPVIFGVPGNPFTGLIGLDYIPFFYETPEGRSEYGFDWMGSTDLLHRIQFSQGLAEGVTDPIFDPISAMTDAGLPLDDVEAIVDFWLRSAYQNFYTLEGREIAIQFLSTDASGEVEVPLSPAAALDYEARIRSAVGFILSAPQGQKQ